jgi:NADH-quinone oxidoreductase subunit J
MSGSTIIFYMLGAFTLVSALLAVITRHIFRAAIFLLFTLIGIAGLYFWMQYEFIAAVQIVVYVGGITVLIIFSIFLTQQAGDLLAKPTVTRTLFSALAAFCGFALTMLQVFQYSFAGDTTQAMKPTVVNIGNQMLGVEQGGYALPFEVVSILLLAALVGCIVIAMRSKPHENIITKEIQNKEQETVNAELRSV